MLNSKLKIALATTALIMGAYGHSAIREWVLGSNTRELLQLNPGTCLCFRA